MWRYAPVIRPQALQHVTRWVVLVLLALVLGVLAPGHQHLPQPLFGQTAHAEGTHQTLVECCLGVQSDPAEPACAICNFKALTPLVPVPSLPALVWVAYTRQVSPLTARAPPGRLDRSHRARAPPALLAHVTFSA
jgi:hypothetical protein